MSKEHPILFSGPMVQAILAGRKTQTRRVVKKPKVYVPSNIRSEFDHVMPIAPLQGGRVYPVRLNPFGAVSANDGGRSFGLKPGEFEWVSPYGQPGDRLWVRETWGYTSNINGQNPWPNRPHTPVEIIDNEPFLCIIYAADGGWLWCDDDGGTTERSFWKPSIHMFRKDSRVFLEITNIRVERVQDISDDDARAEGLIGNAGGEWGCEGLIEDFVDLWDSINEAKGHGWDGNPWVWVVDFKVVEVKGR